MPDLIVWNIDTKECKFVEVKGPGDSLQENQKVSTLWALISQDVIQFFCRSGLMFSYGLVLALRYATWMRKAKRN